MTLKTKLLKTVVDKSILELGGTITEEDANFLEETIKKIQTANTVIDFKDIKGINSYGVRLWIDFVHKLQSKTQITYKNCTPQIVSQMNMITGFKGKNTKIESVIAEFHCEDCNILTPVVFVRGQTMPDSPKHAPKDATCQRCKGYAEMAELPEEFFHFLLA